MSRSPALDLPYLLPAQAQKHVTVNDAITRLDSLVQMRLQGLGFVSPPALPGDGNLYFIRAEGVGAFAGQERKIARWAENTWTFFQPLDGQLALDIETSRLVVWSDDDWRTPELEQLTRLGISATPDSTNRFSVSSPASLFSHAGDDHRLVLNKANSIDTASLMFQSGWSARVELGLIGKDNFAIKLSADGSNWTEILNASPTTGYIGIGVGNPSCPLETSGPIRSGQTTTLNRPVASDVGAGAMIFDTELNRPIWSDGNNWRDAMGDFV